MAMQLREEPNFIGARTPANWSERDLWQEARAKTAQQKLNLAQRFLEHWELATHGEPRPLWSDTQGIVPFNIYPLVVDLSKYTPVVDFKALFECYGIRTFLVRIGGTTNYVADDWRMEEDPQFKSFVQLIRALVPGAMILGYWVNNPGVDRQDYAGSKGQLEQIHRILGNDYLAALDGIVVDDEIAQWSESGRVVTCTPTNLVRSVSILMEDIYTTFRKPSPTHYSARWFIDRYGKVNYQTWFDNQGDRLTHWYAYYLSAFQNDNTQLQDAAAIRAKLTLPTSTTEDAYLNLGTHGMWKFWQFTGHLMTPYVKRADGVVTAADGNLWNGSEQSMRDWYGLDQPPPDDETPPDGDKLAALEERVGVVELDTKRLTDQMTGVAAAMTGLQAKVEALADTDDALCSELDELTLRVEGAAKILSGTK